MQHKATVLLHFRTLFAALFLTVVFPLLSAAHTTLRCESILFQSEKLNVDDFSEVQELSYFPKLQEILPMLEARVLKRYWNNDTTKEIEANLISNMDGVSISFRLENPRADFLARTLLFDDHLFLDLVYIRTYEDGIGTAVGQQAKGPNTLFVKTMAAYMRAAITILEAHPEVNDLVIKGINLKNPMLIDFLKENGFELNNVNEFRKDLEKSIELEIRPMS